MPRPSLPPSTPPLAGVILACLAACTSPKDSNPASDTHADTHLPEETSDTDETSLPDTQHESGDTDESGESGESGDPDTGVTDPLLAPPSWMWQARHFTVPRDRGLQWERDDTWSITPFSVPQIYVRPDGVFVMMATSMTPNQDLMSRWYFTSTDGLNWTSQGTLFRPEDFPIDCGWRLSDGAVWMQSESTYRFILEGLGVNEYGMSTWLRYCQATSTSGKTPVPLDSYFFPQESDQICNSVPCFLSRSDESALLYYNGDLQGYEGDPGIRVAEVDPITAEVTPLVEYPLLPSVHVDPMPVYIAGGGMRLYHSYNTEEGMPSGIGYSEMGGGGTAILSTELIVEAEGICDKEPVGDCLMDPSFIALDDGTLVVYFTAIDYIDYDNFTATIQRAFATD